MRKIRDALRLRAAGLSTREIAASLCVGQSTLSDYLKRAIRAGLVWPLPESLTDAALEAMLFQPVGGPTRRVQAQPDWPAIHRELRRKNVTLALLWEEYRAAHPEGYGYSRFCELYRRWEGRLAPTMRQHHVPGERMFVDYAGATLPVIDAATGAVRQAQLFVAALGASNYLFAEASWTQALPDWVGSHCRALASFDVKGRGLDPNGPRAVSLIHKRVGACLFSLKATGIARDVPTTGPYKGWELVA